MPLPVTPMTCLVRVTLRWRGRDGAPGRLTARALKSLQPAVPRGFAESDPGLCNGSPGSNAEGGIPFAA